MQNNYRVSSAESQTLKHLGIIAVRAGYRDKIYARGKQVSHGKSSVLRPRYDQGGNTIDIGAWLGQQWVKDPAKSLDRMWDFRNHLFHGSCFVDKEDGTLTIYDSQQKHCLPECRFSEGVTEVKYTIAELNAIAGLFIGLDLNRSLKFESSWTQTCRICGATQTSEDPPGPLCSCSQQRSPDP